MNIEELKKEYATQDNRSTSYPIFVTVQELFCVGVMKEGYSVCCPYGDAETKTVYTLEGFEGEYDSKDEIKKMLKDDGNTPKEVQKEMENVEEYETGWIWVDREFFLTIKGAEEYMKANKHNHGKLRTYVNHFEHRNFEMCGLLKELGFETGR